MLQEVDNNPVVDIVVEVDSPAVDTVAEVDMLAMADIAWAEKWIVMMGGIDCSAIQDFVNNFRMGFDYSLTLLPSFLPASIYFDGTAHIIHDDDIFCNQFLIK